VLLLPPPCIGFLQAFLLCSLNLSVGIGLYFDFFILLKTKILSWYLKGCHLAVLKPTPVFFFQTKSYLKFFTLLTNKKDVKG